MLKNRILRENYSFSEDLEAQIAAFVEHYNYRQYHESIANLPRPTSTSGAATPSFYNEKGSKAKPPDSADCNI